jgi:peroxiredoxin
MADVEIGQRAPSFRLPSGQGPEIGPDDFRGRQHLVVWFTKGMACAFCRTQMSLLARSYPRITGLGAEILEVTPTPPVRAQFYARNFRIPFPYLCDPDYRVHAEWGVDVRSHGLAWYARNVYAATKLPHPPPAEVGDPKPTLREMPKLFHDSDMGLFIVDREGVVRYKLTGSYVTERGVRELPAMDEIVRQLELCQNPTARSA